MRDLPTGQWYWTYRMVPALPICRPVPRAGRVIAPPKGSTLMVVRIPSIGEERDLDIADIDSRRHHHRPSHIREGHETKPSPVRINGHAGEPTR